MSDPLSVTASLIAVLQLSATAVQYLKDVKHGSSDRIRLRQELRNATCLLEMLKDRVEDSDDADGEALKPASISSLTAPDGPLGLFKSVLEDLVAKLAPQDRLRRLAKPFTWPFEKQDVDGMLGALERLKTHFSLIMENDLLMLAKISNLKLDQLGKQADSMETKRQDEETQKILDWISPVSFRSKQADLLEGVQQGTGQWFLENDVFRGWMNGDVDLMWCPGIPGAGKTKLVSLIVAHLSNQPMASDSTFAYIYCEYKQRTSQKTLPLLLALLEQLLRRMDGNTLPPEVLSLYELHKRSDTRPTLAQASETLRKIISLHRVVHIVIDALDECDESEDSSLSFVSAVLDLGPNLRLLCTSRFSTAFETFFEKGARLEIVAQSQDIRLFLQTRIQQQPRLARHVRADPSLEEDIVKSIVDETQGMFLLAALHFDSLSQKINRKDVRSSLRTLPKTLDATYEEALSRLRNQAEECVELAETVLFWVLCARRVLTVLELQQMYATGALSDHESTLEDDDLPDAETLTGVCGGLIVVDEVSQAVRLVHYTAQQYFQRTHQDRLLNAKASITKVSLTYLGLSNFSDGTFSMLTSNEIVSTRLNQYPFLDYAARHWGSEAESVDYETLWDHLRGFLSKSKAVNVASQVQNLPSHRYPHRRQIFSLHVPALALVASFSLPNVLKRLVADGHDLEGRGSNGETPLMRAASLGLAANVITLLNLGAAVNAVDIMGESALLKAAANGETDTVRALLDGGADVNLQSMIDWTALMSAVSNANIDVVRMLVEASADPSPQSVWGDSALTLATRNGHEVIANYLADSGAVMPANKIARQASVVASRKGLRELVGRLTVDYATVAMIGLQRQDLADLSDVCQDRQDAKATNRPGIADNDNENPVKDEFITDLSHVVDGLNYTQGFSRLYDSQERLRRGHFGEVYLCNGRHTGTRYAVKIATWPGHPDASLTKGIRNEIKSLTRLRHLNIIRLVDVVLADDMDQIYLVTELAPQGELFDLVSAKGKLTTTETRKIFKQVFSALAFMHERGWVHRDIKPETILLSDNNLSIKLVDFGLCTDERDEAPPWTTLLGTLPYVAPEILVQNEDRSYDCLVDVWSAGVVVYVCLCGFPPFSDELYTDEFPYTMPQQIKAGRFHYPSPYWDEVDEMTFEFIDSMMEVDAKKRRTAAQCLKDFWMVRDREDP